MRLQHGRVSVELRILKPATGRPLLLLHALGESSDAWPGAVLDWPSGPVYALDFSGHGRSERVRGGAYTAEYFLAEADIALDQVGASCSLVGAGLGAYVALLLAGARPDHVSAGLLLDGPGIRGGGAAPLNENSGTGEDIVGFEHFIADASKQFTAGTDPLVAQCERDLRPLEYVMSFAESARPLLFSRRIGRDAPEWWSCALEANHGTLAPESLAASLEQLASIASR